MNTKQIFTRKFSIIILAVFCCLLWGSAFPGIKMGFEFLKITEGDTWSKLLFAGYRFFLSGLFIVIFALLTGHNVKIERHIMLPMIITSLLSTTFQYIFFYIGLSHARGINGAIANSSLTFFTVILAHFFLVNDQLSKQKILGMILGFVGIVIINYSPELLRVEFEIFGVGFIILSKIIAAIGFIYLKRVASSVHIIPFTGYQLMLGASFLILPASLNVGFTPFSFDLASGILTLYLALLSAIAFAIWNTLLKYNPVGTLSLYLFLIPVFGSILSSIFLPGERITFITLIALGFVSSGIVIVNRVKSEKSRE